MTSWILKTLMLIATIAGQPVDHNYCAHGKKNHVQLVKIRLL